MRSEFGKGLTYCLALFLCHSEREMFGRGKEEKELQKKIDNRMKKGIRSKEKEYSYSTELWFNASSDHLYDLQMPKNLPAFLKNRLDKFSKKVIHWGHGFGMDVIEKDKLWAIREAKDLLILIDKHLGVKTEKGDFE